MGLDSVELLMEVEKYFRIRIPDAEAEKIYTVQDMVDSIARQRNITSTDTSLRDRIFSNVKHSICRIVRCENEIILTEKVSTYLSTDNKQHWQDLESLLSLNVPYPEIAKPARNDVISRFLGRIEYKPDYKWDEITLEEFTATICASNYTQLMDPENISSRYEIYIGVMGITVDKLGIDYFEVAPGKSFTTDFGMD